MLADGTRLAAGAVVNAAGTAAARLTPGVPIRPRKGHLAITDRYPGFLRHELIELAYIKAAAGAATESVALNVQPRPTGQLLIGSSRQYDIESDEVEPSILARMLAAPSSSFPAWPASTWYGPGPDCGPQPPTSCRSSAPGRRLTDYIWQPAMRVWESRPRWAPRSCWPI